MNGSASTENSGRYAHLDALKNVTDPKYAKRFLDALRLHLEEESQSETPFSRENPVVVTLFAGNAAESAEIASFFKGKAQVTAVDKELPSWTVTPERLAEKGIEFVVSDALHYLQQLPDESVDIITIYGAEPYLFTTQGLYDRMLTHCARVLRDSGGLHISPDIANASNYESNLIRFIPGIYYRKPRPQAEATGSTLTTAPRLNEAGSKPAGSSSQRPDPLLPERPPSLF